MLSILWILILWTWSLTPLWVNIVGTVLMIFRFTYRFMELWSHFGDLDTSKKIEHVIKS